MSDVLFPKPAGLTWHIKPVPTWSTVVQRAKNRVTTRLMGDPYPLWTFELTYEFLRDAKDPRGRTTDNPGGYSELEQMVGFYNARGGSFDSFLLDPGMLTGRPEDSSVAGAPLGTGDGIRTAFQLQRDYGGFLDEVQAPVGPVFVSANGVVQTAGWTLGAAGVVNFATPPAAGVAITADFRWRWRVRFAEDTLGVQGFMFQLYDLQSLKLEQDRV